MKRTIDYINKNFPKIFTIADAKRGDIGNTSKMYAQTFFVNMDFDSVTINPYMGSDSVKPFLEFENKTSILLGLTSNSGALDIQLKKTNQDYVFIEMIKSSMNWGNEENMMYVVGATRADWLADIRKTIPNHFLLVPGVGAQGGSLAEVAQYGMNKDCGLLVNSSRGIIYASEGEDFAHAARKKALALQQDMEIELINSKFI